MCRTINNNVLNLAFYVRFTERSFKEEVKGLLNYNANSNFIVS